ncbi:MAG: hypothetical protein L6Q99_21285, partial [Planctomycetes bacterium]|nr:hypothetical protein [Planctomycetota bacterium]
MEDGADSSDRDGAGDTENDTAPRRCAENLSAAETRTGCGGLCLAYGVFLETADALSPEVL